MHKMILRLSRLLIAIFYVQASVADEVQRLRGQQIFDLANCYSCHTDVDNDGKPLAGGRELKTPFGVFVTPNITPDSETGIGGWSEQQFIDAIKKGVSPLGEYYFPAFPYTTYRSMRRQDMSDLFAYMSSIEPVVQANKPHVLKWFVSRKLMRLWNFVNDYPSPPLSAMRQQRRGDYIVNVLGHCGECHSPRNSLGMLDSSRHLQGNDELGAPDITHSGKNGVADWRDDELIAFFRDGLYPNGDFVGGHMLDVIDNSSTKWSEDDLNAVIHYLRTLP